MGRPQKLVLPLGATVAVAVAAAATVVLVRHGRGAATGRRVEGGILIGDAAAYDGHSRLLLGSLFKPIAADVAAVAEARRAGARGRLRTRPPVDPAGPPARPRRDRARPRSGHDRARQGQRLQRGRRLRAPAVVPGGRRGFAAVSRRIVRPGREHDVDAPLGRSHGGHGRDGACASPGRKGAHLGRQARRLAVAPAPARSGRTRAGLRASRGERDAVALALAVQAHPAYRTGPRRWLAWVPGNIGPNRARLVAGPPRAKQRRAARAARRGGPCLGSIERREPIKAAALGHPRRRSTIYT